MFRSLIVSLFSLGALVACQGSSNPAGGGAGGSAGSTGSAGSGGEGSQVSPPNPAFIAKCLDLGMTQSQCDEWSASVLSEALPESRGNKYAGDLKAAQLGYELFYDQNVIGRPEKPVRCAQCHTPERAFANNVPLPIGVTRSLRNALPLTNAARSYPHFWDGRADSLWSQPLITIENEDEVNGTRLGVAHVIADRYKDEYEAEFGALPDLSDTARFPAIGKPGMPEWDGMTADDQLAVNRVYVNVGKAFEAYDRKIASGRSDVDKFILGDFTALSDAAVAGMVTFTKWGCRNCHSGPNFSDGDFHALDLPPPEFAANRIKTEGDRGRAQGLEYLAKSEFTSVSQFYDRKPGEKAKEEEDTTPVADGAFLTPSLRNVGDTSPYGHTGVFTTLEEIVGFIAKGGGPNGTELAPHDATDEEIANVVEFLNSLHGETAPLPWSFWPKLGPDTGNYPDAGAAPSP